MNIKVIILSGIILFTKCILSLNYDFVNTKTFTFQENSDTQQPTDSTNELLYRQMITGTTQGSSTCICVASGQCTSSTNPSDGSGQIDIRIVNNGGAPTIGPTSPTSPCQYGLIRCCQPGPYRCGVRYPPVPGSPASQPGQAAYGAYPWEAAILSTGDIYLGSGALINSRHILTVAHKVNNLATSSFKVRLGEWNAAATNEPIPSQDFTVSRVFIHPNFNANNLQNDIAVVRLSMDVSLGSVPTIATVCLPTAAYTGQRCYVSGWGKNAFGPAGTYQSILREVDVPIRSQSECQMLLSATRLGSNFVFNTTSFICAGGEAGKDACTGDGGSPLVCLMNNQWYLAGLVAWGIGCATGNVPGVYVNILAYLTWIQNSINTS